MAVRMAVCAALLLDAIPASAQTAHAVQAAAQSTTIGLATRWNLISIPLVPDNLDPAVVLASIAGRFDLVEAYDGCDARAPRRTYDPAAPPGTNTLTAIDPRIGFWVNMTSPGQLTVSGTQPAQTTVALCAGLNLVGFPSLQANGVSGALASIAGKYSRVWGYDVTDTSDPWEINDGTAPDWASDLQTLQPGRGYYILATADAQLVISDARPTGSLNGLADGTVLTGPTVITGTVGGPNLAFWHLEYRLQGDATFTPFATGTTPISSAPLGTLDPTLLLNGLYEVRLVVSDGTTLTTAADATGVVVEGQQKVGIFTLVFTDLDIPVAGLPIQIVRTYDSRDKRVGDFGVGWSLGVRDVRVQESGVLGANWSGTAEGPLGINFCIRSNRQRLVTVTLPDGRVERFEAVVTPECSFAAPPTEVTLGFRAIGNTTSSLAIFGENGALAAGAFPGPVNLMDAGFTPLDPHQYRLTLADGRQLDLDERAGLQRLTDLNGNTLALTRDGIVHSSGKGVAFARDSQGRITAITEPAGHSLSYSYSGGGDLAVVVDQTDNHTTFDYNAAHDLTGVHDALGRQPIRNDYDTEGRLLAITDASGHRVSFHNDLPSRQQTVVDRLGGITVIEYDQRGNVLRHTDALGQTTTFSYDSRDNKLSETNPLGQTTTFAYDARDNLLSTTDPLGHTTSYTYDANLRPLSMTDPLGRRTTFTYDPLGNLLTRTDAAGNVLRNTYDVQGNRLSATDAAGNRTRFEYDSGGNQIRTINPLGAVTERTFDGNNNLLSESTVRTFDGVPQTIVQRFTYDAQNRLLESTDGEGGVTRVTYSATGKLASSVDPRGFARTYAYDNLDRMVRVDFPDGTSTTNAYDAAGRMTATTDRAGRSTSFSYDLVGRLVKTTLPDGSTRTSAYDAADRTIVDTSENGNTTSFGYDAAGRNTTIRDPLGQTTTIGYDAAGQVVGHTDRNGHTTNSSYDLAGRLTRTTFADGTFTTTEYDGDGRVVARTNEAGNTPRFSYDARGQLIAVVDALGQTTRFGYDEVGNQISRTDALGNTTRFAFDRAGRRVSTTLPLGQTETRTYDASGNVVAVRDFAGTSTSYAYDSLGRPTRRTQSGGESVDITYNPTGTWATLRDDRGTTSFTYDALDRPVRMQYPGGIKLDYTWDARGNRTAIVVDGATTTYTYDGNDRLTTVTDSAGRRTAFSYDAEGNRVAAAADAIASSYSYDARNRLTGIAHRRDTTVLGSYALTLGPTGNRTRVVEASGRSVDYTYDALYRLTGESVVGSDGRTSSTTFSYDAVGNRLTRTDATGTLSYAYDANGQLRSAGAARFAFDANGNMVSREDANGATAYQYDSLNRLTLVTTPAGATVSYDYDGIGQRVAKTDSSGTTKYVVDDFDPSELAQVVRETDAQGAPVADYVYGDDLISATRGGQVLRYLRDAQGSARVLADGAGSLTDAYDFSAFGELLERSGATSNPYLYAGQQLDTDAGLYFLRARYYAPDLGRFVSRDPLEGNDTEPLTLHSYLYANNDPVNRSDPSGESTLEEQMATVEVQGTLANSAAQSFFLRLVTAETGVLALTGALATVCAASVRNALVDAAEEVAVDAAVNAGAPLPEVRSRRTFAPCTVNQMRVSYHLGLSNARADWQPQRRRTLQGPPAPIGITVADVRAVLDVEVALDFLTPPAHDDLMRQVGIVPAVGGVSAPVIVASSMTPAFQQQRRPGNVIIGVPPRGARNLNRATRFTVVVRNVEGHNLVR